VGLLRRYQVLVSDNVLLGQTLCLFCTDLGLQVSASCISQLYTTYFIAQIKMIDSLIFQFPQFYALILFIFS